MTYHARNIYLSFGNLDGVHVSSRSILLRSDIGFGYTSCCTMFIVTLASDRWLLNCCSTTRMAFHQSEGFVSSMPEVKSDERRAHSRYLVLRHPMGVPLRSPQRHSAWQRRDRVTIDMSLFGSSNVDTEGRDHGWRASRRARRYEKTANHTTPTLSAPLRALAH